MLLSWILCAISQGSPKPVLLVHFSEYLFIQEYLLHYAQDLECFLFLDTFKVSFDFY